MSVYVRDGQLTPGGKFGFTAAGSVNNWHAGGTQDPRIPLSLHAIIAQ